MASSSSEPRADFVVLRQNKDSDNLTSGVCLIAEVAETFLTKDRAIKQELYAEAAIPEYWIVNLVKRQIEVYLRPIPEQRMYGTYTVFQEQEKLISPLAGEVIVKDLLPDVT